MVMRTLEKLPEQPAVPGKNDIMREVTCSSNRHHISPPYTVIAASEFAAPVHSKKGGIPLKNDEEMASTRLDQPPAPQQRGRRWLLIGGLAFAFMLALGVGTLLGSTTGGVQAASLAQGSSSSQTLAAAQADSNGSQTLAVSQGDFNSAQGLAATPQAHGQCETLTVSSVNGNTIVAKTSSGSSVTIHTTASTQYTQAGKTVAVSTIKVGTRMNVMGTHNSDGSITATSIDIG